MSGLRLTVNGEERVLPTPVTISGLLESLRLDPRMVVVELNREIIRRPRLGEVMLQNGDQVELVHFVGGG
jgi:thiazole synthase